MAETKATTSGVMDFFDRYFGSKSPVQMPEGAKEWIVKYGPWITVVLLVISVPALLMLLGMGTMLGGFGAYGAYGYGTGFGLTAIVLIAQLGLEIAALPGLFARKMSGWTLLFYSQIISLVYSVLSNNLLGAIIGAVIGFWILFQIRAKYTK